jgi:hypothetical protein
MRGIAGAARRWARPLAVTLPLLGLPAAAGGQEANASGPGPLARAGITGSLRAGYWSSTRDLDHEDHLGEGMLWLKIARPIAGRASFLVDGWTAVRGPAAGDDAAG